MKTISTHYNLLSVDQLCYIETALFMYKYKKIPKAFDNIVYFKLKTSITHMAR